MLALQGQDLGQVLWGFGVRATGLRRSDVLAAFDRGAVVRSWPMRGTLHALRPDDLRMLLALTSERTIRSTTRRRSDLGLTDGVVGRARDVVVGALSGGVAMTRSELFAVLEAADVQTSAQRGAHLLLHLAQESLIVWGPTAPVGQSIVLFDEWTPAAAPVPDRDDALARALVGFLRGRAPATLADFAGWMKLPLGDARRALDVARTAEQPVERLDGDSDRDVDALLRLADAPGPGGIPSAHLLPGYDEYLLGYVDRSAVVDADGFAAVVPGGNGVFLPMMVVRGAVVGTWKRTTSAGGTTIVLKPFHALSAADLRAVTAAAERYGRFAETTVSVAQA